MPQTSASRSAVLLEALNARMQFRLPKKSNLQKEFVSRGEVEEVVNCLEGIVRKVLCFINEENRGDTSFRFCFFVLV